MAYAGGGAAGTSGVDTVAGKGAGTGAEQQGGTTGGAAGGANASTQAAATGEGVANAANTAPGSGGAVAFATVALNSIRAIWQLFSNDMLFAHLEGSTFAEHKF